MRDQSPRNSPAGTSSSASAARSRSDRPGRLAVEERPAWSLSAAGQHYFVAGINVVKSAVPSGARMLRVVIGDFRGPRDRPKNCSIADLEPKNVASTSPDSGSGSTASTKATAVERHSHTSGRTAHAMKTANDAP